MNTQNHDDLERMLGAELHGRVDGMDHSPLRLSDVQGRAGRIRKTRRLVAGGVVAAALAVVVPTVLTAGGMVAGGRGDLGPVPPAASPTPTMPTTPARTTLTLEDLERGDDAAIEYFTPSGVELPGAGEQPLDSRYQALVRDEADGGWIAVAPDGQDIVHLSEDFEQQGGSSGTNGFVTSADRQWVAWVAPEPGAQTLQVRSTTQADAGRVVDLPASPVIEVVDLVASDRVVVRLTDPSGPPSYAVVEPDGSLTDLEGYADVQAASSAVGLISVQTTSEPDGSGCFGVVDAASPAEPVWETCDHSLGGFSPDGRYVMASDPYLDGFGLASLSILEAATGDLVAEFEGPRNSRIDLVAPSWEDGDSIVASALGAGRQVLLRLTVDGTLEEAAPAVTEVEGDLHYYLGRDRARL